MSILLTLLVTHIVWHYTILCVQLLGILLMAASENEDNDILWCVNHDTFPFQKPMMETQVSYPENCK